MQTRRKFFKQAAGAAGAITLLDFVQPAVASQIEWLNRNVNSMTPLESASDEDFWAWVRSCYSVSSNIINLNNGGVSPQPLMVQEAHKRYLDLCNEGPSYYMWRILDQGRESLRMKLATIAGCSPEEIAINRNSTEGLNTVIFGLDLKKGDEVVLCKYDYPNMMNAWKQREKRDGIKLKWVDMDFPMENDASIVSIYENAITSRTKIVHITHMINWTGQLVPARAIADMAHRKGCEVILDAAHSFAQIDFNLPDTGCDYAAASLHKWLNAPIGSGLLFIKKDKIKNVWALLSAEHPDGSDIRKFESLGTRSFASEMAIGFAADFHNIIGIKRKEARLRRLKDYWAKQAVTLDGVSMNTSLMLQYSCALCNFSIKGWEASVMEQKLFEKKKIHSVAIKYEKLNGLRITPGVYTSFGDLDRLLDGVNDMVSSGSGVKKP
jgi:selenocysteine lyase/cysteine desulfurase